MTDTARHTKTAPFQVFVKNDEGEIPTSEGHWDSKDKALMIPNRKTGKPSYVGQLTIPGGPTLHFRAQATRRGEAPEFDALPDFNFFITDNHGNIYRPDGHTWRSFDGTDYCDAGYLYKATTRDGRRQFLKGAFQYDGRERFVQLWFDFKEKERLAALAPPLPMEATP